MSFKLFDDQDQNILETDDWDLLFDKYCELQKEGKRIYWTKSDKPRRSIYIPTSEHERMIAAIGALIPSTNVNGKGEIIQRRTNTSCYHWIEFMVTDIVREFMEKKHGQREPQRTTFNNSGLSI